MRSARWLSARIFLCAGRAEFPEFFKFFRPIFAQILRDLGAGLVLHLALERAPIAMKKFGFLQQRWPSSRNFSARGAPKIFRKFAIFFARVGRKICVIPTLDVCFFSDLNAMLT